MKSTDYIIIHGWMVCELKLSGNELLVFALIHGTDGKKEYKGSLNDIARAVNCSKSTVQKALKSLIEKNFITKDPIYIGGEMFNIYTPCIFHAIGSFLEYDYDGKLYSNKSK